VRYEHGGILRLMACSCSKSRSRGEWAACSQAFSKAAAGGRREMGAKCGGWHHALLNAWADRAV
jgi:hypothetical protein